MISRSPMRVRAAVTSLTLLSLACLLGPLLLRRDPTTIGDVLAQRFSAPLTTDGAGGWHLLGTDAFGRDVLARLLVAGRLSLLVGVAGALLSGAVGALLGALAGWRAGIADTLITAAADTLQAIPRLVLLLACAALWRPGIPTLLTVLALTGWMGVARLVRAEVQGLAGRDFVAAARVLGATPPRLLGRHVIPNAIAPALVATTLGVGSAILLESGLSFLGLGVQPPAPSWGNMIAGGREHLVTAPWIALAPGLAVVITVTSATLIGDWLQERAAGRTRG
ncbi:MAG TPA: ABC transporter permease [Gemmatimonadaceae bacterium]|nr:ABC transporter permease [Gemmatimonadaceae bacterium]